MANGSICTGTGSSDGNHNTSYRSDKEELTDSDNSTSSDNINSSSVGRQNCGGYFGAVNVFDSKDILVGNKAILNGDVTINQYIYPNEIKENNPLTDNLPVPQDIIVSSKNGDIKTQNGKKRLPMVHITQQQSVEKGLVREWWRWMSCAFAGALLVMLVLVFLMWWLKSLDTAQSKPNVPKQYPFDIPENLTYGSIVLSNELHYIQRSEWFAADPDPAKYDVLKFPIPYIFIHHTVTPGCFSDEDCRKLMLSMQIDHIYSMDKQYGDIGYNFVIGGNGYLYLGRSWEYMGAHTLPYNRCSFGIAFIGSYNHDELNEDQLKTLKLLLYLAVETGKIRKDYRLYAASKLVNTESPGKNVVKHLKNFSHYSIEKISPSDCISRIDLSTGTTNS